jgi:hypothetical protein
MVCRGTVHACHRNERSSLMRVLGARLRYQATRKGGTNKVSDLQQHELFTA